MTDSSRRPSVEESHEKAAPPESSWTGLSDAETAVVEGLDRSMNISKPACLGRRRRSRRSGVGPDHDPERASSAVRHDHGPGLVVSNRRATAPSTATRCNGEYGGLPPGWRWLRLRRRQVHPAPRISGKGDLPCALADLLLVGRIGQVSVGANAVNAVNALDRELRGPGRPSTRHDWLSFGSARPA